MQSLQLDICHTIYKNKPLINKPLQKIAKILNIKPETLISKFTTRFAHLELKSSYTARKILLYQTDETSSCEKEQVKASADQIHLLLSRGFLITIRSRKNEFLIDINELLMSLKIPHSEWDLLITHLIYQNDNKRIIEKLYKVSISDNSRAKLMEYFLRRKKSLIYNSNKFGHSIFHMIASQGHFDLLLQLAQRLEVKDIDIPDRNSMTPLHVALRKGGPSALKLLEACNLFTPNQSGVTPLHVAAKWGESVSKEDAEIYYSTIINKIPISFDLNTLKDTEGQTPLHYAAINNVEGFIDLLLKAGNKRTTQDNGGNTPLLSGVNYNNFIPFLADEECFPLKNNLGRNVFHIAAKEPILFAELKEWGDNNCKIEVINQMLAEPDHFGITPFMYAQATNPPGLEIIESIISDEHKNLKFNSDQLACISCKEISDKPVISNNFKILCECCAVDHPKCKNFNVDQPLAKFIKFHEITTRFSNSYRQLLVNNVHYLGAKIAVNRLRFNNHSIEISGDDFKIKIYNEEHAQAQPRLLLSLALNDHSNTYSVKAIKQFLERHDLAAKFSIEIKNLQNEPTIFFYAILTQDDLKNEKILHQTLHSIFFTRPQLLKYFFPPANNTEEGEKEDIDIEKIFPKIGEGQNHANGLQRSSIYKNAIKEQVPGNDEAFYLVSGSVLNLYVPIPIKISSTQILINYLAKSDPIHRSLPIIINNQLYRKLAIELDGSKPSQFEFTKYIDHLKGI